MEEENDWAVSNLGETDICVLGKHYTDKHVRLYRIKVPDPEACLPPSYFSSPLFKLKKKKQTVQPQGAQSFVLEVEEEEEGQTKAIHILRSVGEPEEEEEGQTMAIQILRSVGEPSLRCRW